MTTRTDKLVNSTFLGESFTLKRRWVVQAFNVNDASYKVIEFCKKELAALNADNPDEDVEVDLRFTLISEDVSEI